MRAALDAGKRLMRILLDRLKIRAGGTGVGHEQEPLGGELPEAKLL
jgi:hypothetical protein